MQVMLKYGNRKIGQYNLQDFQKDVVSFGRQSDNDIVFDYNFVSRIHGVFYVENDTWFVEDLNSSNGLFVNGNRVHRQQLTDGDVISIQGSEESDCVELIIREKQANKRTKTAIVICSAIAVIIIGLVVGLVVYANRKKSSESQTATATDAELENRTDGTEEQTTTEDVSEDTTTEATTEAIVEDIGFSYEDIKRTSFMFSSGAGGWGTDLSIEADGSFSGQYHDSEMGVTGDGYPNGTVYYSEFSGHFGELEKIDEYTYATTIVDISYANEPDTQEIKDEIMYCYSEAYGLENAGRILFYLPGKPLEAISETEKGWVNVYLYGYNGNKLPTMMLCNENEMEVFAGGSRLPEQYQVYQNLVEGMEEAICSNKDQVAYADVTGDGVAELIFVARSEQSGNRDLYIYTIENGTEKLICYYQNWEADIEGGNFSFLFQRADDSSLYAMSVIIDGYGSLERYFRFDMGQDGMLYPTEILKWDDSREVHDEFSYAVECYADENSVSFDDFFSRLENLMCNMESVLLTTYDDFDFETYYEDAEISAPYFCIEPYYHGAMHIYVDEIEAASGEYRGTLLDE